MKIDINNAELKEFNEIFLKVLDKHAPKNRNILELIILILLQKLFGKKLCTDLDFATNF